MRILSSHFHVDLSKNCKRKYLCEYYARGRGSSGLKRVLTGDVKHLFITYVLGFSTEEQMCPM